MKMLRNLFSVVGAMAFLLAVQMNAVAGTLFGPPVDYPAGIQPFAMATADLNGDGILDLVVTNNPGGTARSTVAVLLGNGDGSFQAPVFYRVGPSPTSVAIADLNGDGKLDLAVASPIGTQNVNGAVSILLGKGDGTFQASVNYAAGQEPIYVAVADLNGDGKLDMVAANNGGGGVGLGYVSIVLGNGNGTFQKPLDLKAGKVPQAVAVGDFNGDGKLDLAIGNQCYTSCQKGAVSVMFGNGDGTFQKALTTPISSGAFFVAASDLNGDGKLDVVAAEYLAERVTVLLGNGNGTFQSPIDLIVGNGPRSVAIDDLDGDGVPDLAVANYGGGNVSVLLGRGDGTFQNPLTIDVGFGVLPVYVIVGDFNGDHKPDLAVTKSNGYVSILLNIGQ
jgi:uncharacterized protein (DUF2141 family)